jgi:hypothetical protein
MSKKHEIGSTSFKDLVAAIFRGETMDDNKGHEPQEAMEGDQRQIGTLKMKSAQQFFMFSKGYKDEAQKVMEDHERLHDCAPGMIDSADCHNSAMKASRLSQAGKAMLRVFWMGVQHQFPQIISGRSDLTISPGWVVSVDEDYDNRPPKYLPDEITNGSLYLRIQDVFTGQGEQKIIHEPNAEVEDPKDIVGTVRDPVAKALFSLCFELKVKAREIKSPPENDIEEMKKFIRQSGNVTLQELSDMAETKSILTGLSKDVERLMWAVVFDSEGIDEPGVAIYAGWKIVKFKPATNALEKLIEALGIRH